jgi:hypothetical protein
MSVGWSQTFGLDLELVRRALPVYAQDDRSSIATLEGALGIGRAKVEGLNPWLRYLGLRDPRSRRLTPLAALLAEADPNLTNPGTLAIFHFLLASNPDATVWFEAVNHFIPDHPEFTRSDLRDYFDKHDIGQHSLKQLISDIGIFLNAYTDPSRRALQSLGFLKKEGERFTVERSLPPHPLVLAFCLYHRRERGSLESTTAVARLLNEDGSPGRIFALSESELRRQLSTLQSAGLVSVIRIADLDGVSYGYSGTALALLRQFYGAE